MVKRNSQATNKVRLTGANSVPVRNSSVHPPCHVHRFNGVSPNSFESRPAINLAHQSVFTRLKFPNNGNNFCRQPLMCMLVFLGQTHFSQLLHAPIKMVGCIFLARNSFSRLDRRAPPTPVPLPIPVIIGFQSHFQVCRPLPLSHPASPPSVNSLLFLVASLHPLPLLFPRAEGGKSWR